MKIILLFLCTCLSIRAGAQQYDLVQLLKSGRLAPFSKQAPEITPGSDRKAISAAGITWLEGISFDEGTIEVDLRGKDVFQQSFLGIAFGGRDTAHYEVIYFRPFNFGSSDTLRQKHTVQYMSMPDYPWYKLRKEQPLQYENAVVPVPGPTAWFHATICVEKDTVRVFVNHAVRPSLTIKRLGNPQGKRIGLWDDGLPGDFADLVIGPASD